MKQNRSSVKVAFEMFAPDQKVIGYTSINPQNTPGEWQSLTSSITIPENFGTNPPHQSHC